MSQAMTFLVACVMRMMVRPWSASLRRSFIIPVSVAGSRPDVASSRKNRLGRVSSSTPMDTRLRWPPLSCLMVRSAQALEVQLVDDLADALLALLPAGVGRHAQAGGIVEGLVHGEVHVDDVVLRDVAHLVAVGVEVLVQVDAVQEHGSLGGGLEAAESRHQRGLARAAAADHGHELLRLDGERDVLQDAQAFAHDLAQVEGIETQGAFLADQPQLTRLEDHPVRADADDVVLTQCLLTHQLTVHVGAGAAAHVLDDVLSGLPLHLGVHVGHLGVGQMDARVCAPRPSTSASPSGMS